MSALLKSTEPVFHTDQFNQYDDGDGGNSGIRDTFSVLVLYPARASVSLAEEMNNAAQMALNSAAEQLRKAYEKPNAIYELGVTLQFVCDHGYRVIEGITSSNSIGQIVSRLRTMEPDNSLDPKPASLNVLTLG